MLNQRPLLSQRLMQFLAWFVFGFCSIFILTGVIVGQTKTTHAEELAGQEHPNEQVDEVDQPESSNTIADTSAGNVPPESDIAVDTNDNDALNEHTEDHAPSSGEQDAAANIASADPPQEAELADSVVSATESLDSADLNGEEVTLRQIKSGSASGILDKSMSFFGIFALIGIAWLISNNRRRVNWKLVGIGVGLQLSFAVIIFYVPGGQKIFEFATEAVKKLLDFTADGSHFIFHSYVTQGWEPGLINFAFAVLPTIIFFSALMTILYHLGIMQKIVHLFAWVMQKTMNISGAESMSAAANIFVGQTEAPLVIKPYVNEMTPSELMTVMTGGFATVAGGVLAIYVGMLEPSFPDIAGHLLAASVMSAPAALVIAKIIYPETGTPVTANAMATEDAVEKEDVNVLDAASRGAAEGLKLALNVGAMLLAFIALVALINYIIGLPSLIYNKGALSTLVEFYTSQALVIPDGCTLDAVADDAIVGCIDQMKGVANAPQQWIAPVVSMQDIFGIIFWPFAWIMGVPVEDCYLIGRLLGEKMVINELVAYASLQQMLVDPEIVLNDRSVIIATYALCGFANFGSIGIQLGGIGGIAPDRKRDLAIIALRAMIGGTLAAFMTATIAGILI